jgi:hypothetical protein
MEFARLSGTRALVAPLHKRTPPAARMARAVLTRPCEEALHAVFVAVVDLALVAVFRPRSVAGRGRLRR